MTNAHLKVLHFDLESSIIMYKFVQSNATYTSYFIINYNEKVYPTARVCCMHGRGYAEFCFGTAADAAYTGGRSSKDR